MTRVTPSQLAALTKRLPADERFEDACRDHDKPRAKRKTTAPKLLERDITKQCIDFLRSEGWYCIRLQNGTFCGAGSGGWQSTGKAETGRADWLCLKAAPNGLLFGFFLEMKAPNKTPSAEQKNWARKMEKDGFACHWCNSLDALKSWNRVKFG